VIEVPPAVAVPWFAAEATATEAAVPPPRLSVIGFAVLSKATVALTAPAVGAAGLTVIVTVPGADVPPVLVAV
jgi:hypothetical protein